MPFARLLKNLNISVLNINFNLKQKIAVVKVHLQFDALIDGQNQLHFDCESVMDFKFDGTFWEIELVTLPKTN